LYISLKVYGEIGGQLTTRIKYKRMYVIVREIWNNFTSDDETYHGL